MRSDTDISALVNAFWNRPSSVSRSRHIAVGTDRHSAWYPATDRYPHLGKRQIALRLITRFIADLVGVSYGLILATFSRNHAGTPTSPLAQPAPSPAPAGSPSTVSNGWLNHLRPGRLRYTNIGRWTITASATVFREISGLAALHLIDHSRQDATAE